jgi:hypothetical protein
MSTPEQPSPSGQTPPAGPIYSPEQYGAAAADIQQSQPSAVNPADTAAQSNAAMTERGPTLPAEDRIDALMAVLRQQSEQLEKVQGQLGVLQRQQEEAQAASGGPLTIRYAQGAADKIDALVAANAGSPSLGAKDHYAAAQQAAADLRDATRDLVKNGGGTDTVEKHAGTLRRFIDRVHSRQGGGHVDWSAIIDDVELAVEEAAKLVAAA